MAKYVIGMDFGTLSARALIVETGTGREIGTSECAYRHKVMTDALPDGTPLPPEWALQHPADYIEAMEAIVPEAMRRAGIDKNDVIGIGIDFTSSTLLPVDGDFDPMCGMYPSSPHAYVKLWKHHATQKQADRMTALCERRKEAFLDKYGGKVSSEWLLPKVLQFIEEDEELYDATARLVEAGDWLTYKLTGRYVKSGSMAGYKAFWNKTDGYPSKEYLKACHKKLENVFEDKLSGMVMPVGSKAGELTRGAAERLGLNPGTAVAVAQIDAHVSLPAAGITESGDMCMIMGTSTCHIVLGKEEKIVPGMCGAVEDGVVPGLVAFEAGQSCVGDQFNWFVDHSVPAEYAEKAKEAGLNLHQYLTMLASKQLPGETGLIALDWWNGNRSVLVDASLSGLIVGMTLNTRAEDVYRALIESTAFGTRVIIDTFENNGVNIKSISACGGISQKNPFLMQVYADVLRRDIKIARSTQTPALGSAILGAVAAGSECGGYDSISAASKEMGGTLEKVYHPLPAHSAIYDRLYAEYRRLHDYFGRGQSRVMKRLKDIKKDQSEMRMKQTAIKNSHS